MLSPMIAVEHVYRGRWPYIVHVGTEAELRASGVIVSSDVLPRAMPGCTDRNGVKISRLGDGRLRVALDAHVGARRDAALQRVLADALRAAGC